MAPHNTGTLRVWRPQDLESLELLLGKSFRHPYPRHWHEEFLISAITGGAGYFHYRGVSHLTARGSLFIVAPGEIHANYACDEGCSFRSIYIPVSLVLDAASQVTPRVGSPPNLAAGLIADSRILHGLLRLHQAMEDRTTALRCESLLLSFLVQLIRGAEGQPSDKPAIRCESVGVRRAQEFLNEHYNQHVSLKDLAALANLSPYHFHRVFCRQTGIPPHAYQIQLRIMRARTFLRKHWPIAHVAASTGFADQSHFTRHFKRLMGVTPAQYAGPSKNVQDNVAHPG